MFEDNPFYTPTEEELNTIKNNEDTVQQTVDTTSYSQGNEDTSNMAYDVKFIDNDIPVEPTTTDKIDAVVEEKVQTPTTPVAEEKKSTGVSSYTEVPDIMGDDTKPIIKTFDNDFAGLLTITVIGLYLIQGFKVGKFNKILEKFSNFILKFSLTINIILFAFMCVLFSYPNIFNVGISGQLNFCTILLFGMFAYTNANIIAEQLSIVCKKKEFIFKNKLYTFPGIKLLNITLTMFAITVLLFTMLTESSIALSVLYLLCFTNKAIKTLAKSKDATNKITKDNISATLYLTTSIILIGILTNSYIITTIGTILTGYFMPIRVKE